LRVTHRRVTGSPGSRLRLAAIIVVLLLVGGLTAWRMSFPSSPSAFSVLLPGRFPSESSSLGLPGTSVLGSSLATVPTSAKPTQSTQPQSKAQKSKAQPSHSTDLTWASGVSYPDLDGYGGDQENATNAFGSWRGKSIGVAVVWPDSTSWDSFIQSNAFYTNWAAQSYTKVFGLPPFPSGQGDINSCDNGDYNQYWATFAQTMNSTGLAAQGTIIRLGWEFNESTDWGTPTQFATCWQQIVSTVQAIAPGLQWDWNVNRGSSGDMPDDSVLSAYPGDAYVNIIGIDSYDDYTPVNAGGWQQQLNGPYGLNYWLNFAKEHGKKLSVPEWGLVSTNQYGSEAGGDDPTYIQDMYNFFVANRAYIAFESYYDSGNADNSIYYPSQFPNGAAEYAQLWSSAPTGT
jgi:hypothetical protein